MSFTPRLKVGLLLLLLVLLVPLAGALAVKIGSQGPAGQAPSGPGGLAPGRQRAAEPAAEPPAGALKVLFVGNSYVYVNDLPGLLGGLAQAADPQRPSFSKSLTPGGFTLQRHLDGGQVQRALAERQWDAVILQDQSQQYSFSERQRQEQVYPPARRLDALIDDHGARVVFYLTWGRQQGDLMNVPGDSFEAMQDRLTAGYRTIAAELEAEVAPAGPAWRRALARRPELALWSADGSHPSLSGSYLTACVMLETLFGVSPVGNGFHAGLPEPEASFLQAIAHETCQEWSP